MSSRAESSSSVIRTKSFKDRYTPSACDAPVRDSNAIRGGPSQLIALHKAAEERSGTNSPVPDPRSSSVSRSSSRMGAMLAAARERSPHTGSSPGRNLRGSKSANDRGYGSPLIRDSTSSSIRGSDNLSAYQDEHMQHDANALEARAAEAEALILQKLEEIRRIREQVNTMVMQQFQDEVSPGKAAAFEQSRAANDASLAMLLGPGPGSVSAETNSQLRGLGLQPLDPITSQAFGKPAQPTNYFPSSSSDPYVPPAYSCSAFPGVPGSVDSPNHRPTPSSGLYRASSNTPALPGGKAQAQPYPDRGRRSASPAPSASGGGSLLKSALARSVLNSQQGQSSRLPSAAGSVASSKGTRFSGRRSPTVVSFDDQPITSVPLSPVAVHRRGPMSDRASQGQPQPQRGPVAGTASPGYDAGTYVPGSGGGKRSRQQSNAKLSGFAGSEGKQQSSRIAGAGSFHNRVAPFISNNDPALGNCGANPTKRLGLLGRLSRWLRGMTRRGKCAADGPRNQSPVPGQGMPVVNKYGHRNKQPSKAGSFMDEGSVAGSISGKRRVFRVISTSQASLPGYY